MITITGPLKYHSAYNPIKFHVVASRHNYPSYTLNVDLNYKGKVEQISLVRILSVVPKNISVFGIEGTTYDGEVDFDISGVVRNYFGTDSPKMSNDIEVDNRLFVNYTCEGKQYVAINSTEFASLTEDDLKFGEKLLTALPVLRRYEGYDFDISLLLGDNADGFFTPNAVNRVKPRAIPVRYLLDEKGNYIQDENGAYILIDGVHIVDTPVPRNPFYVRWINRLGGVDYWMFGGKQQMSINVKDVKTLINYSPSNNKTIGLTAENQVIIGASGLSKREWEELTLISISPDIEWYNEKLGMWQNVTVSKAENVMDTDMGLHSLELTFNLPTLQTQFA